MDLFIVLFISLIPMKNVWGLRHFQEQGVFVSQMENKPLWFSLLLSVPLWLILCLSLTYSFGWCNFTTSGTKMLIYSCVNNTFKAPKCMTKALSSLHVLSFFFSVSQVHMYKSRHSFLDPPFTHLRQLFLRAPENITSAKQTTASRSASSHDLCPLLLSGVPLTLTEVHCTALMLCLKQTAIHFVSEKLC